MTRQFMRIRITPDMLVELCKDGPPRMARIVAHGLPKDAQYVRHGTDENGYLNFIVWSASFPEVPEGNVIPVLPATLFETVYGRRSEEAVTGV